MSDWTEHLDEHRSRQADRIMHAAGTVLVDRGLSALNMRSLAEAAGISRPTLYKYFPDVDSVLISLADVTARQSEAELQALLAVVEGAEAKLRTLIRGALHLDQPGQDVDTLHWALTAVSRDVIAGHLDRMAAMIAEILTEGVREGVFRADLDIELDARFVRGALSTVRESLAIGHESARVAGIAERTILRAVSAR